jgi:alpha-tubulin suppressor-like RCC1 family protein
VRCWGANVQGELGNGTTFSPSLTPSTASGIAGSIGALGISSGADFTCARRGNGVVSCWGQGTDGQLGNGLSTTSSTAVNVSGLNADAINVSAGGFHACVARAGGTVACWGRNTSGQLGIGNQTAKASAFPIANFSNVIQAAGGAFHTCALVAGSTVQCWGKNDRGQLGAGTNVALSTTPVAVANLSGVVAISSGDVHSCAVKVDATVWCWGDNAFGQLGDNAAESFSSTPVKAIGIVNALAVAVSGSHSCALEANGGVLCWGDNNSGDLGDSTVQVRTVPTQVTGISQAKGVAAGGFHSCAIRVDGTGMCWGDNGNLQLSASDTAVNHTTPVSIIQSFVTVNGVQIPIRLSSIVALSAGSVFTCSLETSGAPACWGENFEGEVGNGTSGQDVARPAAATSFTANVDPNLTLNSNDRSVTVRALINCPEGARVHIYLDLEQGPASGNAVSVDDCTGGLANIPMKIHAHGPADWHPGAATAHLEAIVKDKNAVIDDQHWERAVTLSSVP